MGRIQPITKDGAPTEVSRIYDAYLRMVDRGDAGLVNLVRYMAHSPEALKWFLAFWATVHAGAENRLSPRLRQLVTTRTSMLNACEYCVFHNSSFSRRVGVTPEELDALASDDPASCPTFSDAEIAAIEWASAITTNEARPATGLFERLEDHFDTREIVELSLAAAMFNMINRLNEAWHTDLDPTGQVDEFDHPAIDGERLHRYVRDVLATTRSHPVGDQPAEKP